MKHYECFRSIMLMRVFDAAVVDAACDWLHDVERVNYLVIPNDKR